ncbi:MAG: glycosyltransferase family 4 protein [Acidobacteriota bacterium]|nr:glycosyltransferase family 4 protein [Acidobacteriota bacterium]
MRIAHVICTNDFAGVERHVLTLAEGLAASGHEILIHGGADISLRGSTSNYPIAWFPYTSFQNATRWIFSLGDVDVVHVHMTYAEAAAALSVRRRFPLVCTRHFASRRGSSWPAKLAGRWLSRRIDLQIAISYFVASHIESPSTVVYPGVPVAAPGPPAGERLPVVLMAQRLEKEKHTEVGIAAWAESGLAKLGWELHIAGEGRERNRLEASVDRLGLGTSCRFLGYRQDIAALQRSSSIFLATTPEEGLGLSVLEAMAAGTPVVATASGGHAETVGAVAGAATYLPQDAPAAGQLLAHLAGDPQERDAYGNRLRDHQLKHFSIKSQVSATLDAYGKVR